MPPTSAGDQYLGMLACNVEQAQGRSGWLGEITSRPFTVRRKHVADALLDFRFDLGVLIEPSDDLLIPINGAKMAIGGGGSFAALFVPKIARD